MRHVKIQGKRYPFKLTVNATMQFEEEFGMPITQAKSSVRELFAIGWYGLEAGARLEKKDLDITREELGDVISFIEINKIAQMAIEDLSEGGDEGEKKPEATNP